MLLLCLEWLCAAIWVAAVLDFHYMDAAVMELSDPIPVAGLAFRSYQDVRAISVPL
jgi:hypothetical protein